MSLSHRPVPVETNNSSTEPVSVHVCVCKMPILSLESDSRKTFLWPEPLNCFYLLPILFVLTVNLVKQNDDDDGTSLHQSHSCVCLCFVQVCFIFQDKHTQQEHQEAPMAGTGTGLTKWKATTRSYFEIEAKKFSLLLKSSPPLVL